VTVSFTQEERRVLVDKVVAGAVYNADKLREIWTTLPLHLRALGLDEAEIAQEMSDFGEATLAKHRENLEVLDRKNAERHRLAMGRLRFIAWAGGIGVVAVTVTGAIAFMFGVTAETCATWCAVATVVIVGLFFWATDRVR